MDFDGYNLRGEPLDDVLGEAERAFGLELDRASAAFGTQGASVGFPTSRGTWVHLAWFRAGSDNGLDGASTIPGVRKPELYRAYWWQDHKRHVMWRADESERVISSVVDLSGVIAVAPELLNSWWLDLSSSLTSLAGHETPWTSVSQAHLTRRINDVFSDANLDTAIAEWTTAHGDLHWGNITAPQCYLLDWESCGRGPRGLDAATLWGHSLRIPQIADRVQEVFESDLNSRSGLLAQMMFCANIIRLGRKKSAPGPLVEPATREAERLLVKLSFAY